MVSWSSQAMRLGTKHGCRHCEHYVGRGVMVRLTSGQALAQHMGVALGQLASTFTSYNACAEAKSDTFGKTFFRNAPYQVDDVFHVAEVRGESAWVLATPLGVIGRALGVVWCGLAHACQ